jgi:membrane-bound ClpP family serine protease
MDTKRKIPNLSLILIILAIAFIAIGINQQRAFIFIGAAFLVIALVIPRRKPG